MEHRSTYTHYGENSLDVHIGSGLVKDEDLVVPEQCPGQAYQLPLAHAEVGSAFSDSPLQSSLHLLHPPPSAAPVGRQGGGEVCGLPRVAGPLLGIITGSCHGDRDRPGIGVCGV